MTDNAAPDIREHFAPEPLHPDLKKCVKRNSVFGRILHHPLVVQVPYIEPLNKHLNAMYLHKQERIKVLDQTERGAESIWFYERPYRLQAFMERDLKFDDETYWSSLAAVWCDAEGPSVNTDYWLSLMTSERPGRKEWGWDDEGRQAMAELPDDGPITIYRGTGIPERKTGMSWTLFRERAEWFAYRFSPTKPIIYTATVLPEGILLALGGRGEAEVVVDPYRLNHKSTEFLTPRVKETD
jgi:hypothetical protein